MFHIKSFIFSPIQENTYILSNEFNDCIIIDPGCYFDYEKDEMVQYITEMNLHPKMLLNTHCHLDHVFGNKFIAEKYGLSLYIHPDEVKMLELAPASGLMYNMPFDNYTGKILFLNENEPVILGVDQLKVILTPGHSPGSVSFYSQQDGFVISGDALFNRSIGRTDLPGGDHDTLIKNIKEKLLVLPESTKVYSGHGIVTTIGEEAKGNPFLN